MSEESDPILPSHKRFIDAFRSNDAAAVVSFFTDDAVWMPHNEPSIFGKKELAEWHEEYFASFRVVSLDQTERDVTVLDGWAIERWGYLVVIRSNDGEDRIRDDGRCLTIWKQERGEWRIAQTIINSIRPVGSGTSRFLVRLKKKS